MIWGKKLYESRLIDKRRSRNDLVVVVVVVAAAAGPSRDNRQPTALTGHSK